MVLCVLIGAGLFNVYYPLIHSLLFFHLVGIILCIVYFSKFLFCIRIVKKTILNTDTSSNSQGWKIGGIILGAITCIIGIILIIITILKQNDKRPWRYKKGKNNFYANFYSKNDEKDNRLNIENFDDRVQQNLSENRQMGSQSVIMQPSSDIKTHQAVLAQRSNSVIEPSKLKTGNNELIVCPNSCISLSIQNL